LTQHSRDYKEIFFSVASTGFFFVLVGAILAYTAFVEDVNLLERFSGFFSDFEIERVPHTELSLPKPHSPSDHSDVYLVAGRFSIVWGLYQVALFVSRLFAGSPIAKKAETASNATFWLGTGYLINTVLLGGTLIGSARTVWFGFWGQIIMMIGISLIVRAMILLIRA
jgi:hypothetical protein